MTDLGRLKVSLTKHNAHKVARLLKEYKATEVLGRLREIRADAAQTRKNLSAQSDDILPPVWKKVQALGSDAIDALVLIAIVFSHEDMINAMASANDRRGFAGRIDRGDQLTGKAYTNFARVIDQLGYSTKLEYSGVRFSLKAMFEISGLGPLVGELLSLKLTEAGWDRSNRLSEEVIRLRLHKVFGLAGDEFSMWIATGSQPAAATTPLSAKDQEFFYDSSEGSRAQKFQFRAGHAQRDTEPLARSASPRSKANQLHNKIQNELYAHLRDQLGSTSVGSELETGSGTAIDLVTRHHGKTTFYEIKTGPSVRASIRQALPQLLEYAFWPEEQRADELVIVSPLPATSDAKRYLRYLRKYFKLPIVYKQFNLKTGVLC